jgi:hypothetical protein
LQDSNSYTWKGTSIFGAIQPRDLAISDDGEYVAAAGSGEYIYYFAGSTTRTGSSENPTWSLILSPPPVYALDMSSNGRYIVTGLSGSVIFFKDAWNGPNDKWTSNPGGNMVDVAVSDDGYGVAAVEQSVVTTIYYWANALTLSGSNVSPTWVNDGLPFGSVDMSSDGNLVVAGSGTVPISLQFWSNSRTRTSGEFTWSRLSGLYVIGSAISDDGSVIAATTATYDPSFGEWTYGVFFYTPNGDFIGQIDLNQRSPTISISGDGQIVAVAGQSIDSLHVYELKLQPIGGELVDSTVPNIAIPILALAIASTILLGYRLRKK